MPQQISDSELVLMEIIWGNGGTALYSYIMEELEKRTERVEEKYSSYAVVQTGFQRVFSDKKAGRRNEYQALVSKEDYQAVQTHSFLDKVYAGNGKSLVSALLRQDIVSAEELQEIERFWNNRKREGNE